MTRIVIVDDHALVRAGIRGVLSEQPDFEVVAEAENGACAVEMIRELAPDLVIMDVAMPVMNGIDATRQIVTENPAAKILFLSMHSAVQLVTAALDAGGSGYLVKECGIPVLVEAIRAVIAGKSYVSPQIARSVTHAHGQGASEEEGARFSRLTARERQVLRLIAEGLGSRDVAAELGVSVKTVSTHRQNIMDKLEIHNAAGLTRYAIEWGVVTTALSLDKLLISNEN